MGTFFKDLKVWKKSCVKVKLLEKRSLQHHGLSNGLDYLIKVLPVVCEEDVPEILLVGG